VRTVKKILWLWDLGNKRLSKISIDQLDADLLAALLSTGAPTPRTISPPEQTIWTSKTTGNLVAAIPGTCADAATQHGYYGGLVLHAHHLLLVELQGNWRASLGLLENCTKELRYDNMFEKHCQPIVGPNEKGEYWPTHRPKDTN
jgi:hypothetical protein